MLRNLLYDTFHTSLFSAVLQYKMKQDVAKTRLRKPAGKSMFRVCVLKCPRRVFLLANSFMLLAWHKKKCLFAEPSSVRRRCVFMVLVEIHQNGRLGLCLAVWLQAKVREAGLSCCLSWTLVLSMTHTAVIFQV